MGARTAFCSALSTVGTSWGGVAPGSAWAFAPRSEGIRETAKTDATAREKNAKSGCEVIFMGPILTCTLRDSNGLSLRDFFGTLGHAIDVRSEARQQRRCYQCRHKKEQQRSTI